MLLAGLSGSYSDSDADAMVNGKVLKTEEELWKGRSRGRKIDAQKWKRVSGAWIVSKTEENFQGR